MRVSATPATMQTIQGGQKEPCILSRGSQAASGKTSKIVKLMCKDRGIMLYDKLNDKNSPPKSLSQCLIG